MMIKITKQKIIFGAVCILVIGFVLGFLISRSKNKDVPDGKAATLDMLTREADEEWSSVLIQSVNAANIRTHLKKLTKYPHLAGTPADKRQADELVAFWKSIGLKTHITKYDALLSYPDLDNPSRIELQDENGTALFTTQLYEKILRPDQNQSNVAPPFNAYAAPGSPKGDLIYVNYGTIEDFKWLTEEKGMDFQGRICISRYGKIFRGQKAKHAEQYGALGLIIYSDPADYSLGDSAVYPDTWFLPDTGVQRGTLTSGGEPLTPAYPALDSAYRKKENETDLPGIPVHPISYGDARIFLQNMGGEAVPVNWQGGMNFTYHLGPGFINSERKVQMFVTTHNQNASVYNAFGIIKGTIEPDRYVLIGNHRDAWVFGAIDPSSGTASMLELSRVFVSMLKKGWKPRRTIIFCSWAAEEYGLIGSREFVEDYRQTLSSRAVAYLNMDAALEGNYRLWVGALPLLFSVARDVAKKIPNPDESEVKMGHKTVFDTWLRRAPQLDARGVATGKPKLSKLGSGSDYAAFIGKTGISCVSIGYTYDERSGLSSYPLYHSMYETFHLVDEIMDPGFKFHKAVTQYLGELARRLSDFAVLPMRVTDYSQAMERHASALLSHYGGVMRQHGLSQAIDYFLQEVDRLKVAAVEFEHRGRNLDKTNPIAVRMYNDQMTQLERVFIDPLGLPGRPYEKHVVYAPSMHNDYAGSTFPGLVDTLFDIETTSGAEHTTRWEQVKQQMSVITYFIHAAAAHLQRFAEL